MIGRCVVARAASVFAVLALSTAAAAEPPTAEPLTADRLPQRLLADCDARAEPFGQYAPPIAAAARALTDLGVFTPREFSGARIGFCELQRAGGPVAAAACGDGVILLDEKYAADDQALPLRATLAHEMKHHLQHRDRRTRHGAAYCTSALYTEEKAALEAEADAFGDTVAELLALGRAVEIVNACGDPVSIYLEADDPVAVRGAGAAFQRVPAQGMALLQERALSGQVRFYARTTPQSGKAQVWEATTSAQSRFVEGQPVRLKSIRLAVSDRLDSPFRLRLSCRGL